MSRKIPYKGESHVKIHPLCGWVLNDPVIQHPPHGCCVYYGCFVMATKGYYRYDGHYTPIHEAVMVRGIVQGSYSSTVTTMFTTYGQGNSSGIVTRCGRITIYMYIYI